MTKANKRARHALLRRGCALGFFKGMFVGTKDGRLYNNVTRSATAGAGAGAGGSTLYVRNVCVGSGTFVSTYT